MCQPATVCTRASGWYRPLVDLGQYSMSFFASSNVQTKLNANPYDTRGEEIRDRYEDDYKFHRYTNRYGNAFGSEFYTIRITCR